MASNAAPYYPIIYVRGYAMSRDEIDQTTADPFCGFNIGTTVYRANCDKKKPAKKLIFESPLVRLVSDFDYSDVYEDGLDIMDEGWTGPIPSRSVIIYRYYDPASNLLGSGKTPEIEQFARGLSDLVLKVRDLVCSDPKNGLTKATFRCYLVAHSMGGLVCRTFLQNPKHSAKEAKGCVDKVFTYATPHNGIEIGGLNVPGWLSLNDMNNFSRERMADYLNLKAVFAKTKRVDWLPEEAFPSQRFFCVVATNRADYGAAAGASRTFAGHGSDGLVGIENASVWGINASGKVSLPCATAYVYRSHSGYFGVVNSEESYQNLVRFLFGDLRVDIWLDVDEIKLPEDIQKEADKGKDVTALYQFELLASPRGKLWYLTRRVAEEDSVACRSHNDLHDPKKKDLRSIYLSTVFLGNRWRVNTRRRSLAYSLTLGVRVPDYEVDQALWLNKHYEGSYLFRDSLVVEMTPPASEAGQWQIKFDWQTDKLGEATRKLETKKLRGEKVEMTIPFASDTTPGINGQLRFVAAAWNV